MAIKKKKTAKKSKRKAKIKIKINLVKRSPKKNKIIKKVKKKKGVTKKKLLKSIKKNKVKNKNNREVKKMSTATRNNGAMTRGDAPESTPYKVIGYIMIAIIMKMTRAIATKARFRIPGIRTKTRPARVERVIRITLTGISNP